MSLLASGRGVVGDNADEEFMTVASFNPPSTGLMLKEGGGGKKMGGRSV